MPGLFWVLKQTYCFFQSMPSFHSTNIYYSTKSQGTVLHVEVTALKCLHLVTETDHEKEDMNYSNTTQPTTPEMTPKI